MPFRNTFMDKIKCLVNAAQTHKAISQRHAELGDRERSDSSTIDTHLHTKAIYCLVMFRRGKSALLLSSCHPGMLTFYHFLCACIQMTVAMVETSTDHLNRAPSLFVSAFAKAFSSYFI